MKAIMYSESSVFKIPKEVEEVHFARPLKYSKLKELLEKKRIERIFASESTVKRMPAKAIKLLQEKGIGILVEKMQGRPLSSELEKIIQVRNLRNNGESFRKIQQITGVAKSTAHYLERYAQKSKVKKAGQTISLK